MGTGDYFATGSGSLGSMYRNPSQPPWSRIKPTPETAAGIAAQMDMGRRRYFTYNKCIQKEPCPFDRVIHGHAGCVYPKGCQYKIVAKGWFISHSE